ncbi:MAG: hypothetical protein EA353_09085 [Puniceicoccaceae bacterium]|nr:MAG: hypothetical protein EA353_09085 [Puniceicoccaceae bacterium]
MPEAKLLKLLHFQAPSYPIFKDTSTTPTLHSLQPSIHSNPPFTPFPPRLASLMKAPLDKKINELLASRPLQPDADFTARVLAATEVSTRRRKPTLGSLLKFSLPLAAAIALALSLLHWHDSAPPASALTTWEAQEIFLLEDSLASLATLDSGEWATDNLLDTLEILYLEI